jgi:hypothetical protein
MDIHGDEQGIASELRVWGKIGGGYAFCRLVLCEGEGIQMNK